MLHRFDAYNLSLLYELFGSNMERKVLSASEVRFRSVLNAVHGVLALLSSPWALGVS